MFFDTGICIWQQKTTSGSPSTLTRRFAPPSPRGRGTAFKIVLLPPVGYWCISLLLGPKMSDVGMSHVRCRMYLSNDPKTRCDIWSSGHVTNTFDIVHGTSQHLTLHVQQSNAPLLYPSTGLTLSNFKPTSPLRMYVRH